MESILLYSNSKNPDFFYASKYYSSDKMILLIKGARKYLAVSDLEFLPAKKKARECKVIAFEQLGGKTIEEKIAFLLKKTKTKRVVVPQSTPIGLVNAIKNKVAVKASKQNLFPERMVKKSWEVNAIKRSIKQTQDAILLAKNVLEESRVSGGKLFYENDLLTCGKLRNAIELNLFSKGLLARDTIVSCGKQSASPHERGSGPIYAGKPVIIDVFPQDQKTRYFADLTRTFCKGKPSEKLRKMHETVLQAQENAFDEIKDGAKLSKVHETALETMNANGFATDRKKRTGFFHSTGHGLGLDVHEEPRIGDVEGKLLAAMVVTIEPGLYYPQIGGVRIEDDVLVTKRGCKKLSDLSKELVVR